MNKPEEVLPVLEGNLTFVEKKEGRFNFKVNGSEFNFSIWGEFSLKAGDWIKFSYITKEVNGRTYYNLRELIDFKRLGIEAEPNTQVNIALSDIDKLQIWKEVISKQNDVLLMKCAVDLCMKRGTLSDEEIKAQIERFKAWR